MAGPNVAVLNGQVWEARVRTRLYGQICLTRFWFEITNVPVALLDRSLIELHGAAETIGRIGLIFNMSRFMGDDALMDAIIWHLVSPTNGAYFTIPLTISVAGGVAGGCMPAQSATTVAYRGLLPLPSRRGHVNVPGIPRSALDTTTGLISTAMQVAAVDFTDMYLGITPLVWGPLGDGTVDMKGPVNPIPALGYAVVQSSFSRNPGTQRQRKIGRGI